VKQITEHGYSVQDVAQRLGVSSHSLYLCRKKYGDGVVSEGHIDEQQAEIKPPQAIIKH
jgi:transposase